MFLKGSIQKNILTNFLISIIPDAKQRTTTVFTYINIMKANAVTLYSIGVIPEPDIPVTQELRNFRTG